MEPIQSTTASPRSARGALMTGSLASVLVSACCAGPVVLLSLGVGGSWISSLTALERYRPIFLGLAVLSLALAYRRIFRPAERCAPGEVCATPAVVRRYRIAFWIVCALLGAALASPWLVSRLA